MTRNKHFKQRVRARKAEMGTSYSTARALESTAAVSGLPPAEDDPPPSGRGMPAWIERVSRDGVWHEPRYWRTTAYRAVSAWSPVEIEEAFSALVRIFPPKFVRGAFARREFDYIGLLSDPWRADVSPLVPLGFDAAHARVWDHADLWRRLLRPSEFIGASHELALFAVMARASMRCEPEPFAGSGGPNPDARIWLGDQPLIVECKLARQGGWSRETEQWRAKLGLNNGADQFQPKPHGLIVLTEALGVLFAFEQGAQPSAAASTGSRTMFELRSFASRAAALFRQRRSSRRSAPLSLVSRCMVRSARRADGVASAHLSSPSSRSRSEFFEVVSKMAPTRSLRTSAARSSSTSAPTRCSTTWRNRVVRGSTPRANAIRRSAVSCSSGEG